MEAHMESTLEGSTITDQTALRGLLLSVSALAIGMIAYGPFWWTIGLSILYPVILFKAESRLQAFFIALFYLSGASRSLAIGAAKFYGDDLFFGTVIWALGNGLTSLVYTALWHRAPRIRIFTIPAAVILTAFPPLGVLGWANPLTAAGVIFPGTGLAGLLYLGGLYGALATGYISFSKLFLCLSLWSIATGRIPEEKGVQSISSTFRKTDDKGAGDYQRQTALIEKAKKAKGQTLIFAEGMVSGGWTEVPESLWRRSGVTKNRSIVIGADILRPGSLTIHPRQYSDLPPSFEWSQDLHNGLVILDKSNKSFYLQRQPIPFSMWKPFSDGGYKVDWFGNPVVMIAGKPTAALICYEGFLVWPILHSYLSGAERIVAVGNFWWTNGKELPTIHASIIRSWSRLFSIPHTVAVNL